MDRIPEGNSDRTNDIQSRLLQERIIFLGTAIDEDTANSIIAQLLFLDGQNREKDIYLYLNSPGGSVTASLAIYDTIVQIKPDVVTVCSGLAAGTAAIILSAGASGKRMALADSRIIINKPIGGTTVADIEIQAIEIAYWRRKLAEILSTHTGQPIEKISLDMEGDYFLSPLEAKEYGIIDTILDRAQSPK